MSTFRKSTVRFSRMNPKFFAVIESGLVVDTTMPNSIQVEAYRKLLAKNDLRWLQ